MDQRGVSLPIPGDPTYPFHAVSAQDELLMSFGPDYNQEAWDPETQCFMPVPVYAGMLGHWSAMDQGNGSASINALPADFRLTLHFCFDGAKPQEQLCNIGSRININMRSNLLMLLALQTGVNPEVLDFILRLVLPILGFENGGSGFWITPNWLLQLYMLKTDWGWDRVTTVGPQIMRMSESEKKFTRLILPAHVQAFIDDVDKSSTFHYPLFQVIDGNGEKTKDFPKYLRFANNDTDCPQGGTFECPDNNGNGTSYVGVMTLPGEGTYPSPPW